MYQTLDPMAVDNVSRESDYLLSYNPADPDLRDSPALAHLQRIILQVRSKQSDPELRYL